MSSLDPEEDTELRDLVANTLQSCGVLGKIKVMENLSLLRYLSVLINEIYVFVSMLSTII